MKMLVLAMAAAFAAMAFIGASSASAEIELCSTNTSPCTGIMYEAGKTLKGSLKPETIAELSTSLGTVKCKKSETAGKQNALSAAEKLDFSIETASFEECTLGASSCTVETQNKPYLGLLLLNAKKEWHLVVEKATAGKPQAHITCTSGLNCTFGSNEILFSLTNPTKTEPHAILTVNQSLEREGGFCPTTSTWKATYLVLEPLGYYAVG